MANSLEKRNTIVKFPKHKLTKMAFALLTTLAFTGAARAQSFSYTNNDLALGFRKTGNNTESYEAVVNIGSGTNYVNLQSGTTIDVPNFTPSQLTPDTFSSLNFL